MKNQKGFIIPILILFSLVILGLIAYFFSPKSISLTLPTPQSTLTPSLVVDGIFSQDFCGPSQTRTKFSVKVPYGWKVEKGDSSEIFQEYKIFKDKEYITITCGTGFGGGCEPKNIKFLNIAGKDVQSCIWPDLETKMTGLGTSYINHENGTTFSFIGLVNEKETLDQILSTFKFTN